jgi:hypothetical protein
MGEWLALRPIRGCFIVIKAICSSSIYRALRANMPQRVVGLEAAAGEGLIDQLKETLTVVIPL